MLRHVDFPSYFAQEKGENYNSRAYNVTIFTSKIEIIHLLIITIQTMIAHISTSLNYAYIES